MIDQFYNWLQQKAHILAAIFVGAVITTAYGWRSFGSAARQMIAGLGCGYYFGPVAHYIITHMTPFTDDSAIGMAYCATAISGLWIVEGIVFAAKRWAQNPSLPKGGQ